MGRPKKDPAALGGEFCRRPSIAESQSTSRRKRQDRERQTRKLQENPVAQPVQKFGETDSEFIHRWNKYLKINGLGAYK